MKGPSTQSLVPTAVPSAPSWSTAYSALIGMVVPFAMADFGSVTVKSPPVS